MHVAKKQRKAVFLRGPYDGWVKDFIDDGQKDVRFGEPGRYNDIYVRQEKNTPDNKVQFLWNATLSNEMRRQWAIENNIDPEMLQSQPKISKAAEGHDVEESPRVRIEVKKNSDKKRWELWVPGSTEAEAVVDFKDMNPDATQAEIADWIRDLGVAR